MFTRVFAVATLLMFGCLPAAAQHYTCDTNGDRVISLSELLRVIQFYNGDGFHCQDGTEDGYASGPGGTLCIPYDTDYNVQDWSINLAELLRAIQLYNAQSYHLECGTEDGFAPYAGVDCGETQTILLPGGVPLKMVWVPAGTLAMGSLDTEQDRVSDEGPQHPVTFVQGFWIGKYEFTQAQWKAVMNGANPSFFQGGSLGDTDERPVEQVSWESITQSFLPALNTATGKAFRLPSEAEWEFAARADTNTRFYWGDDATYSDIGTHAWYLVNSAHQTHDVGTAGGALHPNAWDLYDMGGNVQEWCGDWYHDTYSGAPTDGSTWETPVGTSRVYRGGSWNDDGSECRSAHRSSSLPGDMGGSIGFRLTLGEIEDPINLGSTNAFAILAGSTVSNTGPSIITGDLGVSPGTAVVGIPPGILNGAIFTGVGSAAGQAKLDLTNAYNEAAGRSTSSISLPGDLSGLTLYPGLYTNSTSVMLSAGNVTLDAQGDSHAVFVFQMGSTLTAGTSTQVILSGGAKATNIYWQVGTSASLGTYSRFKGNILASASITLATGATLDGRALTQDGAVTLDASVITAPAP